MPKHLILGLGRLRMHESLLALGNRTRPTADNLTRQWVGSIGLAAAVGFGLFPSSVSQPHRFVFSGV